MKKVAEKEMKAAGGRRRQTQMGEVKQTEINKRGMRLKYTKIEIEGLERVWLMIDINPLS